MDIWSIYISTIYVLPQRVCSVLPYLTLAIALQYIDRNNVIPSRNGKCTLTNRPWQNQIHMNDDIIMMTRLAPS